MPTTPVTWLDTWTANTITAGIQTDPQVVQLADGTVWLAWTSEANAGAGAPGGTDIIARRYDPLGQPLTAEVRLNQAWIWNDEGDFALAATPAGTLLLGYIDHNLTAGTHDLRLETLSAAGVPLTSQTLAAHVPYASLTDPQIAIQPSGSALITWRVDNSATSAPPYDQVFALTYDPATGTAGTPTLLLANDTGDGAIGATDLAALSNGSYVAVMGWGSATDSHGIAFRIVAGDGTPGAAQVLYTADTIPDSDPSVAALAGGGFVIAWTRGSGISTDIRFQIFDAAGTSLHGPTPVNDTGGSDFNNEARVTPLADGGFVIFYDDDTAPPSGIRAQRYDATGTAVGTAFALDSGGSQPEATLLADGRLLVTWLGGEIRGQIVDPRDGPNATGAYAPDAWQIGTVGDDSIAADPATSTVHGWDGNDTLAAGPGSGSGSGSGPTAWFGGAGDDLLRVETGPGGRILDGGAGTDTIDWTLWAGPGALFDLAAGIAQDTPGNADAMAGFENLAATAGDDTITGTVFANLLSGAAGHDSLFGGDGDDTLAGGDGNDTLHGGTGADVIAGNDGNDRIEASQGADTVHGGAGNDTLFSSGEGGSYFGDEGDDVMRSASGSETLRGGAGNDTIDHSWWAGSYLFDMTFGTTQLAGELFQGFEIALMGAGNDTVTAAAGGATIFGGAGDDSLIGSAAADHLAGGLGDDILQGGDGDDSFAMASDAGTDTVEGGAGTDLFDGSAAALGWVYHGSGSATSGTSAAILTGIEVFAGSAQADLLTEGGSLETLLGNDGDDTLVADATASPDDRFEGGSGIDLLDLTATTAGHALDLAAGTLSGHGAATGFERATGGSGDDHILGTSGDNMAWGGAGNDTLEGREGDDLIAGGDGADLIGGDDGADTLSGGAGDDGLYGATGNDWLSGGAGNDTLHGGAGYDTADYSAATDALVVNINYALGQWVSASQGRDILVQVEGVQGGTGNDLIVGTGGGNILDGGVGDDQLYGLAGADILRGGAGNDTLEGSGGNDSMQGGEGVDALNYYNAAGAVSVSLAAQGTAQDVGGSMGLDWFDGFEALYGSSSYGDALTGDAGANTLIGYGGGDTLAGGAGADTLYGMQGDDVLGGGAGGDLLGGGAGADTFVYAATADSTATARDSIADFTSGADLISLGQIDADTGTAGDQAFAFIAGAAFSGTAAELRFVTNGTDGFLQADTDGNGLADLEIRLLGVTAMTVGDVLL